MALPIIPIAAIVIGLGLTACVKAINTPKPDRPLYQLAGSEWGPVDGSAGFEQFVQFGGNGEMSGSGGCNNFFGTYDLNGTQLTIGPLASTKKMCANMAQETAFLKALQQSRRIEATHFTLALFDEAGDELLRLQRRDWD